MTAVQATSSQTAIRHVLFLLRLYFSMEVARLVVTLWEYRDVLDRGGKKDYYFKVVWINLAFSGFEVIFSGLAFKKKSHKIFTILTLLMIGHLVFLCLYFVDLFGTPFNGHFLIARIYATIGIGILFFALIQGRVISQWIKEGDKIDAMTVAYFKSRVYPARPSNQTYPTAAHYPSNGPSHPSTVATIGAPVYPTTAPVPTQSNHSPPNPSELACPAYVTVAGVPYDSKEASYPGYPPSGANPAVYPSLDTQVPIQNTNPPTHPST